MAITQDFREYANQQNQKAGGAQNAQLQVDFEIPGPSFGQADKKTWRGSLVYDKGQPHTERLLIAAFWRDYRGLGLRQPARLLHVQVFTRFNACLSCTDDLINFSTELQRLMNAGAAQYDVADRGNLYLPEEGLPRRQISIEEGKHRRGAAYTSLRFSRWVVEFMDGPPPRRVTLDLSTLGTQADPIVLM